MLLLEISERKELENFLGCRSILVILKLLLENSFFLCSMEKGVADDVSLEGKVEIIVLNIVLYKMRLGQEAKTFLSTLSGDFFVMLFA